MFTALASIALLIGSAIAVWLLQSSLRLLRPLAVQGNANAQFNLGMMYQDGHGVPQDDSEAVQWFRRAAIQGFMDAQSSLGAMYMDGRGVPQNHTRL
jgi:TPR repeat protein